MIFTDRTITVRKGESRIDEPIVVYRGDYELEVRFTILNSKFKFMSGTNMIESEKASYGQLAILTPYGGNIFSDIVRCNDGSVTFVLTADMLNQIEEVGLYSFQIRLMDYNKESRVSIPPIEFGIEVREPIASEDHDNSVNNAIVGYSIAKVVDPKEENVGDTFDESGNYNKTKWETGDRISEGKLNKIEDAVDKVNENEVNNTATLSKRIDNNFNVLDAVKADKNAVFSMANMGQDIKEAMTGGSVAVVGKNAVLTENIVDGQVTGDKIAEGTIDAKHLNPYLFTESSIVDAIVSYTKEQTTENIHLMIGVDMELPAGTHTIKIGFLYSNSLGDNAIVGSACSISKLDFDNTKNWTTYTNLIARNNSYIECTIPIAYDEPHYVMIGLQIPRSEAQEKQRITISDIVCTLDDEDVCHLLKYDMHKKAHRYTYVKILSDSGELTERLRDIVLNDESVTPDKLSNSAYETIDERVLNGYFAEQTLYDSPKKGELDSHTTSYFILNNLVIPKGKSLSYIRVNAVSEITIVLCNIVESKYIPFSIQTYSPTDMRKGVTINEYANDDIFIIIGGVFKWSSLSNMVVDKYEYYIVFSDVEIDTIEKGRPATIDTKVSYALFDMEVRIGSRYSKTKNALDNITQRLKILENQLNDTVEVLDSYDYESDIFSKTSLETWTGALAKAYPKGYMRNLTSKYSRGFTVGLATFNGRHFTPYATYVIGEELPDIIPVKSDTYIIIHGSIGYNTGITSVDPCRFYDVLDVGNLTVGIPYRYEPSEITAGFDISFEIVSSPSSILESIQIDIENFKEDVNDIKEYINDIKEYTNNLSSLDTEKIYAMEHQITSLIHAVEENIPEAGDEPKVLENQLIQVWDNDLSQEHKHWKMGNTNGSRVSNGFTATGACWYVYDQYLTFDTFRQKAIVTVNDASSVFGLVCKHTQKGALYLVHGDTNTITLHAQYTGGSTIPTVKATTQLPFTITAGKKYLLDIFKTGWKHTFTITDMETMQSASVTFDNSTQSNSGGYCGKGWGGPGVIIMSGDVVFHNHRYYVSNYKTPRVMFIGDSITEGTNMGAGADIKYRWCSLLRSQYFGYDALICGRGGATSGDILQRMNAFETLDIKPDIVIILDGTNERSASGLSGWKTNMPLIVSKIESWGAKPIICVPPVSSSGFSYIAEMRDFILTQGWNTIRMDIATSLNHDGQTYDSSLYTDGVHPNIKGSQQMFERAVQDLNIIL